MFRASTAKQIVVGDDVPEAMVVKMRNQWVMEYHSIVAKLKQDSAGVEDHHNTLATERHARRRCCWPWGRKTTRGEIWRSQTTTTGWMGAQGRGEAVEHFAVMTQALVRRRGLNGAAAMAPGKQRKGNGEERRRLRP